MVKRCCGVHAAPSERESSSDDENDTMYSEARLRRNAHNIISEHVSPTPANDPTIGPKPKRRKTLYPMPLPKEHTIEVDYPDSPLIHRGHDIPFVDEEDSEDVTYISSESEEEDGSAKNPYTLSSEDSEDSDQ